MGKFLMNSEYQTPLLQQFPTMWYVRTEKAQTSLRIRAVCSEPLLIA